jgi:two-component system, cell cycle response regulator DivK
MASSQGAQHVPEEPAPRSVDLPRQQRRPKRNPRREPLVLVVDDSQDVRDLYTEYLHYTGFRVLTASDGEGALEVARRIKPDVIVLDLSMPRLDGISATVHLRRDRSTQRIPIILLTGYPARASERGALEAGANAFLTKPCLPEDLELKIRELMLPRRS